MRLRPTPLVEHEQREREPVPAPLAAAAAEDRLAASRDGSELPPDENAPSLRRRILRPQTLISFGIAIAILVFFARRLDVDLGAVWSNIKQANLALLALAFAVYYGAFILRSVRWRLMLAQAGICAERGYVMPSIPAFVEIYLLSWFANCVVPAKLGDAYRAYLLKRRTRASFSTGFGTIVAERLADLIVLFAMMSVAGVIAFRGHLPGEARRTLIGGVLLLAAGAIGLVGLWLMRARIHHRLPSRLQDQFGRLHDAIFSCLRRPWRALGVSIAIWATDGLRLLLVAAALGQHLSVTTAVFVALMSSLLTTLPVTPAGLGVVEAAMIVVLKLVDVESSMAGSIALIDRFVTYWSIILVGSVLYVRRMRADVSVSSAGDQRVTAG